LVGELGFSPDRVTVVHPDVDPRYSPGPRPKSREPLAVGRLAPVKRYDVLVRAAHAARQRVPDLRLEIVGEGFERRLINSVVDELDAGDGSRSANQSRRRGGSISTGGPGSSPPRPRVRARG
jgi:glycosyltransferase involved in cell wall biosynthesis